MLKIQFKQAMLNSVMVSDRKGRARMVKRDQERYRPERPNFWLAGNKKGL